MQASPSLSDDPYPVPLDQRFYIRDVDELRAELDRLGLDLPFDAEGACLRQPLVCPPSGVSLSNRWVARMAAGCDAAADGTPSAWTHRRYTRPAAGGFGLILSEPVAVSPATRRTSGHLCLTSSSQAAFAELAAVMRTGAADAAHPPVRLLTLDVAPDVGPPADTSFSVVTEAVRLALAAGFDGVAVNAVGGPLVNDLDAAAARGDPFHPGDALVSRFVEAVRTAHPGAFIAVRLCVFNPRRTRSGFGACPTEPNRFDAAWPGALMTHLAGLGVGLFDVTTRHPALRAGADTDASVPSDGFPHEHPLSAFARRVDIVASVRKAVPDVPLALDGMDWPRQFLPALAAGLIGEGAADAISLGRFALAYPEAPRDWARDGRLDPYRCCIQCGACDRLREAGMPAGCVVQDGGTYGSDYRRLRRVAPVHIEAEARRWLQCVPAPCRRAIPGRPDIPAIMRAMARGDRARAGRILRSALVFPEMSLSLMPFSASGEGQCVLGALADRPLAIRDVLLAAADAAATSSAASRTGDTTSSDTASGPRVTIVGAGPAGLAAAAVLLRSGLRVTLIERADRPGGVPELLIPAMRYGGAQPEIEQVLGEARRAGLLTERYGVEVGRDVTLETLREACDALVLAPGLWADARTITGGGGLYGGLEFLEAVKAGRLTPPDGPAAVLAGGDCAMDAAVVLEAAGATPLYIVYAGSRADMHWCMDEAWFARPGHHLLTLCRPLGVRRDAAGWVAGLRTVCMRPVGGGMEPLAGSEATLEARCVVDAGGLAADALWVSREDEAGGIFAAGALVNGGASVAQCVAEGMQAAGRVRRYLEGQS